MAVPMRLSVAQGRDESFRIPSSQLGCVLTTILRAMMPFHSSTHLSPREPEQRCVCESASTWEILQCRYTRERSKEVVTRSDPARLSDDVYDAQD